MSSVLLASVAGVAAAFLMSTLPWVGARSRAALLAPHLVAGDGPTAAGRPLRAGGVLLAVGAAIGRGVDRVTSALAPLEVRLDRVHSTEHATTFRFRQGVIALTAGVLTGAALVSVAAPGPVAALALGTVPLSAALVPEVALVHRCRRWSRASSTCLPIVGEHLVALLHAGHSTTSALDRIGDDDGSPLHRDIARVAAHLRRGGALEEALQRWSDLSDVDGVHRLARALALHHRTPDLAELLRREVDAVRSDLHRDLLSAIDRRAQQIWIPVTVAALLPGAIFLLVPFFDALRAFGATT